MKTVDESLDDFDIAHGFGELTVRRDGGKIIAVHKHPELGERRAERISIAAAILAAVFAPAAPEPDDDIL